MASVTHAQLSMKQVAGHAYAAGFRGGALVAAIAIADAESGRNPLAVSNKYYQVNVAGNFLLCPNGIGTTIHFFSRTLREMVAHNCRGLWQFNDAYVDGYKVSHADAFDVRDKAAGNCIRKTRAGESNIQSYLHLPNAAHGLGQFDVSECDHLAYCHAGGPQHHHCRPSEIHGQSTHHPSRQMVGI